MTTKIYNASEMAQSQFDSVAEYLELDPATKELLRTPWRGVGQLRISSTIEPRITEIYPVLYTPSPNE